MFRFSRLLCLLGRHHRSRGRARRTDEGFRSCCRRCGVAMIKTGDGKWRVETAPRVEPAGPAAEAGAG